MRNAFADEITKLGEADPRIVVLSGDIGNKLFDNFKAAAPGRFINCGIAEANMMGMAAGMALNGLRPVVYTITPFTTTRCLEQIKIDVGYHKAPVMIVGTGSGLSYAKLGPTHHSFEDIAILRVLPELMIFCPADVHELRVGMRAAFKQGQPIYVRLGKKGEPAVHSEPPEGLELGKALTIREGEGNDVCLIGTGNCVWIMTQAADILASRNIRARVESFHTVKPLDEKRLEEIFARYRAVALAEEHSRIGGLGSAVAEWMARRGGAMPRFLPFGIRDEFAHRVGSQNHLRQQSGLTAEAIVKAVMGERK